MENSTVAEAYDAGLEERIHQKVRVALRSIFTIVRNGHVFLSGEVRVPEEKAEVEARVWNVDGVRSVTNHIRVDDVEDETYRLLEDRVLNCPFKGADLMLS